MAGPGGGVDKGNPDEIDVDGGNSDEIDVGDSDGQE